MKFRKKLGAVAVAIAMVATASAAEARAPASGERADTLTVAVLAPLVGGLSASASEFGNRNLYFQAVYDGLLRAEPDGTIVPWLATEWAYNDDNTVLTMTLRDDVTFTDGEPFNAEAAAQNLIRFRDGVSPDASNLGLMTDAVAVDDTTLEITLSAPDPALLNYLGRNAGLMQSPATFDAADEASNPVGTGPYILNQGDTVADSVYTYNANPDYWAPEFVKFDNFVIRMIQDPTATLNAVRAGEVNAANIINLDAIPEVEATGWDLHTQELDWAGLTLVDRDGSMGTPLGDPRCVRRSTTPSTARRSSRASQGVTARSPRRCSAPTAPASIRPSTRPTRTIPSAPRSCSPRPATPTGSPSTCRLTAALGETSFAIIGDQLGAVGIDVNFVDESNDYFGPILAPNYPAFYMILEQAPNDWQFVNFLLSETAVWNPSHYTDETSAELIATIQTTDGDEQAAAVAELGRYVQSRRGSPRGIASKRTMPPTRTSTS